MARIATRRGGPLVFVIPIILVRYILQPLFPQYTNWSDFGQLLLYFISGYILVSDDRFMQAIRRDRLIYLILGIIGPLLLVSELVGVLPVGEWLGSPGTLGYYGSQAIWVLTGWCWTMLMLYIGMRYLNYTNKWLKYGREASFAFFWVHQPVIIFVAFYAVQWEIALPIKMLVVVIGSFALSLGLYELLVRRINPVRALFGMKPRRRETASTETG